VIHGEISPGRRRIRRIAFAILCALAVGGSAIYLSSARGRSAVSGAPPVVSPADSERFLEIRRGPHVVLRDMTPGTSYGMVSIATLSGESRVATNLGCHRIYEASGSGLCLSAASNPLSPFPAYLLGGSFAIRHSFASPGIPSRVRLSRDGRLAAYTVFTAGDSYLASGFSTRTRIVDVASGRTTIDLEELAVSRDGARFQSVDFNYWGVTFGRDASQFYATLGTHGHTYLVKGDLTSRTAVVLRDGVECPSLSPDETRIAFKKKSEGPDVWRPALLDLATGLERVLPETRSVDDQMEWLDDRSVLYAIREGPPTSQRASIWTILADGSSGPRLFLADAESPAVVRAPAAR
jgi:hypothetical protein